MRLEALKTITASGRVVASTHMTPTRTVGRAAYEEPAPQHSPARRRRNGRRQHQHQNHHAHSAHRSLATAAPATPLQPAGSVTLRVGIKDTSPKKLKHPKTSRAGGNRNNTLNGGAKSPDLWVSQRRQRMNYDREGLKTAGPSSRPSSRPNSKGDAPGTASDNNNTEKDGRAIARSNSTIEERPSSMATRSRQANYLSDRNTLTASPLHVPGKHQLGVLRGRKMHNRAHL